MGEVKQFPSGKGKGGFKSSARLHTEPISIGANALKSDTNVANGGGTPDAKFKAAADAQNRRSQFKVLQGGAATPQPSPQEANAPESAPADPEKMAAMPRDTPIFDRDNLTNEPENTTSAPSYGMADGRQASSRIPQQRRADMAAKANPAGTATPGAANPGAATAAGAPAPGAGNILPGTPQANQLGKNFIGKIGTNFRKNRGLLAGGGGAVGVIVALIMLFFSLLPLKLEAFLKSIVTHEGEKVERYVEKRFNRIVIQYLYQSATGNFSDAYYSDDSLVQTVWGNFRKFQFEEKLYKEQGIKIEKRGNNSIRFTSPDGTFDADSFPELAKYLDKDLSGIRARFAIRKFVNSQIRPWQLLRRKHMRIYLINAYRISRFATEKVEDKTDARDTTKISSTETSIRSAVAEPSLDATTRAIGCMVEDANQCGNPEERENPDGTSESRPPITVDTEAQDEADAANGNSAATTRKGIREAYAAAKDTAVSQLTKALEELFGKTVSKLLIKGVPVVGWLALAADIDHFLWEGGIMKVKVMMHETQYAALASTWLTLADQFKAGELSGSQINVLMTFLVDIEKAQSYQRINNDELTGTKLPSDELVGSDRLGTLVESGTENCGLLYFVKHKGVPPDDKYMDAGFWTKTYRTVSTLPTGPFHTPLCAMRPVFGAVSSVLNFVIGDALSAVMEASIKAANATLSAVTGQNIDIMQTFTNFISWTMNKLIKPVATGAERNAQLYNKVDAGWDVIFNKMGSSVMGAANIPFVVSQARHQEIAAERRKELQALSPIEAITNMDYPESLGTRIVMNFPATPQQAIERSTSTALAVLTNPFRFFAKLAFAGLPTAQAAPLVREPNGVQQTDYSDATLESNEIHAPVTDTSGPPDQDGKITGPDGKKDIYDCPQVKDPKVENPCLLDAVLLEIACAATSEDDDAGLGGHGKEGKCSRKQIAPSVAAPATPVDTGGGAVPSGDAQELAAKILKLDNITYWTNNGVNTKTVLVDIAAGRPAPTTCRSAGVAAPTATTTLNIEILQFIYDVGTRTDRDGKPYRFMINALTDKCHSSSSSLHYTGEAIDIENPSPTPTSVFVDVAAKYGGRKNNETSHHHISFPK